MEAAKKEREIKTWNRKRKTDLILRYKISLY
jgi:predicted GIY-YIG superfamily endonuclease